MITRKALVIGQGFSYASASGYYRAASTKKSDKGKG
jgi:hypothetical protein